MMGIGHHRIISQAVPTFKASRNGFLLPLLLLPALVRAQGEPPAPPADSTARGGVALREVVVISQPSRQRIEQVQIGAETLPLNSLGRQAVLLGERDVVRGLQLLPGVKAESEGSAGFQVRGGTADQNAVLWDGARIYNAGHIGGLFATFNADAMASATLYKGLVPSGLGGATAAVLDISSRPGSFRQWRGGVGVGLLSARVLVEGPVSKDRLSVLACARRSYLDAFLKMSPDYKDNTLYFYDMNIRADWRCSAADRLALTLYSGRDDITLGGMMGMAWTNMSATLHWSHTFGQRASLQTALVGSAFKMTNGMDVLGMSSTFGTHIRQAGAVQRLTLHAGRHTFGLGLQAMLLDVKSAEWQKVSLHEKEQRQALDNSVWASALFQMGQRLSLSAGLRLNAYAPLGGSLYYDVDDSGDIIRLFDYKAGKVVRTWTCLEPRLSLNYRPLPGLALKLGYTSSSQALHTLTSHTVSSPFNRYALSSNLIRPERAHQVSAGVFWADRTQTYDLSVEAYWRKVDHVLDYRDGKTYTSEIEIERLVLPGQGRGYGVEWCFRKSGGRLTGWLAYTLSWQKTRIDGVNGGRWYDASNDRRHVASIVASYQLSGRWQLNATWTFASGRAYTAPSGKYEIEHNWIYYYAERNGYRTPATHRLDVSAVWGRRTPKTGTLREWTFGVYNCYNRYNPFLITFEDSSDGSQTKARQYSLLGIVPSVSYAVSF